jgi:hypothetical protein
MKKGRPRHGHGPRLTHDEERIMDETPKEYGRGPDDSSHYRQHHRVVHIDCGDGYLSLGRAAARRGDTPLACRLLVKAAAAYQGGGLAYRGQVAWRLAQWLHAGRFGEVAR